MSKKEGSKRKLFFVLAGIFLLITYFVLDFNASIEKHAEQDSQQSLLAISQSNALAVSFLFDSYINSLNTIANILQEFDDVTSPYIIQMLNRTAKSKGYARLAINFPNGISYTSDGAVIDYSSLGGMEQTTAGTIYIDDVANALIDGAPLVNVHVPLKNKKDEQIGVLRAAVKTETLNKSLNFNMYNGGEHGFFYVIDGNGRYVAVSNSQKISLQHGNYYNEIDKKKYKKGFSGAQLKAALENKQQAFSQFEYHGVLYHAFFSPIDINNWYSVIFMPEEVVRQDKDVTIRAAATMTFQIALIILIVFLYLFLVQKSASVQAQLDEECFRMLAEQSGKIVFEWTVKNGKPSIYQVYRSEIPYLESIDMAFKKYAVHPDDVAVYEEYINAVAQGQTVIDLHYRVKDKDDRYHWWAFSSVTVKKDNTKAYKSIGTLADVHDEIIKEERLMRTATIDNLTQFYNKNTTKELITDTILNSGSERMHAFMCLDLDNFKIINDTFGHMQGDKVLRDLTAKIKHLFRATDILGRFGGDEFVLFIKDISSPEFAKERAHNLNEAVKETYEKNNIKYTVSASIGIAIYPNDATTYDDLYQKADEASYTAKRSGKNRFIMYSDLHMV